MARPATSIPTFLHSCTLDDFYTAFNSFQCVIFRDVGNGNGDGGLMMGRSKKRRRIYDPDDFQGAILKTLHAASPRDRESWTIETAHDNSEAATLTSSSGTNVCKSPSDFLSSTAKQNGYCSFLLQDNSNQAVSEFTEKYARHSTLPVFPKEDNVAKKAKFNSVQTAETQGASPHQSKKISVAQPYWIFIGRNSSPTQVLRGRTEHVDEIHQNCGGTFHYQAAGSKLWKIRPTEELQTKCNFFGKTLQSSYEIMVNQGDIFVINTHLWWHQTEIPILATATARQFCDAASATAHHQSYLSISYARDIYLNGADPPDEDVMNVINQEGAWSIGFIAKGTTLLTEEDPPMIRTSEKEKSNCKLVVVGKDDDGKQQLAVLAIKDIQEGEFFTLLTTECASREGGE